MHLTTNSAMANQNNQLFDPEIQHSLVRKIPNKSTKTKARASLPDILCLKVVDGQVGIYTNGSLPQATQFGPLEAPLATKNQMDEPTFLMKLDIRRCRRLESSASSFIYYDTTDENMCNWMILVRPAKIFSEQNLCAYQNEDFVYFTTTREIQASEELRVWYSPTYAKFMGAELITPTSGTVTAPKVNPRRMKSKKSRSTRRMQVYPNSLVMERDVRSIPPKKRGWRRTKRLDSEKPPVKPTPKIPPPAPVVVKKSRTCEICGKTFKDRTKLNVHSVVHSSVRNFLCHHCGATFKRNDKLKDHVKKYHERDRIKSKMSSEKISETLSNFEFRCEECVIGFHRRGMLLNHIMKRHPETRLEDLEQLKRPVYRQVKKFQCPYCTKMYKSNTKRKLHVLKHHPDKSVPPSLKGKRGASSIKADKTIITEKSVRTNPFKCDHCTMEYSMKHKLQKHIREKHPQFYESLKKPTCSNQSKPSMTPVKLVNTHCDSKTPENPVMYHQGNNAANGFSHGNDKDQVEVPPSTVNKVTCSMPVPPGLMEPVVVVSSCSSNDGNMQDSMIGHSLEQSRSSAGVLPQFNQTNVSSETFSDVDQRNFDIVVAQVDSLAPQTELFHDGDNCNLGSMIQDGENVQNLPGDVIQHDLLSDSFQAEPASVTPSQTLNYSTPIRSETYSRYSGGRKGILKAYENDQNQLQLLRNESLTQRSIEKQGKAKGLGSEFNERSTWVADRTLDVITQDNETRYSQLSNVCPESYVDHGRVSDPILVYRQQGDWRNDSDITYLIPVNRENMLHLQESRGT